MENLSEKDWSNLPVHKPDVDLWDKIDTELGLQGVSGNLDQLPKYSPKINLWNKISLRLTYYQYLKYIYFAGIGITAAILFFVITNTSQNSKEEIKLIEKKETITLNKQTDNIKEDIHLSTTSINNTNEKGINKLPAQGENIQVKEKAIARSNNKRIEKSTISDKGITPTLQQTVAAKQNISQLTEKSTISEKEITKNEVLSDAKTESNKNSVNPIVPDKEISKAYNSVKSENNVVENTENTENPIAKSTGIEPKKVNLKSTQKPLNKGYSSVGLDYTVLGIFNKESFSYTYNQLINLYGINYQYNYSNYLFQTAVSYSTFSDNLITKVHLQKDQYNTFNYVDSVIYNSQGQIIQYITHPITVNDSIAFQEYVNTSKKYSLVNIPILAGYQWDYGRIKLSLKTGFLFTMIISEKTSLVLPYTQNIKVKQIEASNTSIRGIKTAGVISAALSYDFTKRWGLCIEPVVYYYFKPLYDNMDLSPGYGLKSPWLYGIKTNLFYKF